MVIWQDIVIMIANIVFAISLVPQVYHGFQQKKPFIKIATSLPTTLGIIAITFSFYTLDLLFSAAISLVAAIMWALLLAQGIMYNDSSTE